MRTKGDKFRPVNVVVRGGVYHYRLKGWASGKYRTLGIPFDGDPKTEEVAHAKAWEEFRKGDEIRTGAITLGAYAAKFYGPECPHTPTVIADGGAIQTRTAAICRGIIKNHVLPLKIMSKRVCDIGRADAVSAKMELVKKLGAVHLSTSAFRLLRTILKTAYENEMMPKDPLVKVSPIKPKKSNRRAFSREEIDRFLQRENFESDLAYALIKHAYLSGMRRGEILALTWDQFRPFQVKRKDPATGQSVTITRMKIVVDRAWKDDLHEDEGLPKWEKTREFPCTEELEAHLKWWKERNPFNHSGLIYKGETPKSLTNRWWADAFDSAFKKVFPEEWAEFEAARESGGRAKRSLVPHSLRHTLATEMAGSGVSDRAIQAGMGWADSDTQSIYTHLEAERMVDSFDEGARRRIGT